MPVVVQCVDKVVEVPVVQVDGSSRQGVHEFFAGVKGVGDVLAGRGAGCSRVLRWCQRRRRHACWAWSRVLRSSSQLSRASVTCLLGVEQCVEEFFAVVNGVCDVLAGRGAGC